VDKSLHSLRLEGVWPASSKDSTTQKFRRLDDVEFFRLLTRMRKQILSSGVSLRHANYIARCLKLRRSSPNRPGVSRHMPVRSCRCSEILDALLPVRQQFWTAPIKRRDTTEITLTDFSFLDNPHASLESLRKMAENAVRKLPIEGRRPPCSVVQFGKHPISGTGRGSRVQDGGSISRDIAIPSFCA